METIHFKKSGDPLKIKFVVKDGVLAAAYWIKLAEKNSNKAVATYEGDNQNTEDDTYYLPTPPEVNHERLLRITVDFYGLDLSMSKKYAMGLEIYQGDELLKYVEKKGDLSTNTQSFMAFAFLKTEDS